MVLFLFDYDICEFKILARHVFQTKFQDSTPVSDPENSPEKKPAQPATGQLLMHFCGFTFVYFCLFHDFSVFFFVAFCTSPRRRFNLHAACVTKKLIVMYVLVTDVR